LPDERLQPVFIPDEGDDFRLISPAKSSKGRREKLADRADVVCGDEVAGCSIRVQPARYAHHLTFDDGDIGRIGACADGDKAQLSHNDCQRHSPAEHTLPQMCIVQAQDRRRSTQTEGDHDRITGIS